MKRWIDVGYDAECGWWFVNLELPRPRYVVVELCVGRPGKVGWSHMIRVGVSRMPGLADFSIS